ncbi:polysaccharide biosynthesis/export family protein [Photobacterium swingsii]|uniref:polysaccharide biosynthesis/export family protein n=1 Tax=Photobacterium swingsii TaxID=680026 RepID=UPI000A68B7BE
MDFKKKLLITAMTSSLLVGCAVPGSHLELDNKNIIEPEQTDTSTENSIDDRVNVYPLTTQLVGQLKAPKTQSRTNPSLDAQLIRYQYRVGPGDILNVTIWDHPELTIPAGSYRSSSESGNWVHADGTIFYPYIGLVKVEGKTVTQIRDEWHAD